MPIDFNFLGNERFNFLVCLLLIGRFFPLGLYVSVSLGEGAFSVRLFVKRGMDVFIAQSTAGTLVYISIGLGQ